MKLKSYINWQIDNKKHINIIYNMIVNKLENNNIIIIDKHNLYIDITRYLYKIKEK